MLTNRTLSFLALFALAFLASCSMTPAEATGAIAASAGVFSAIAEAVVPHLSAEDGAKVVKAMGHAQGVVDAIATAVSAVAESAANAQQQAVEAQQQAVEAQQAAESAADSGWTPGEIAGTAAAGSGALAYLTKAWVNHDRNRKYRKPLGADTTPGVTA